MADVPPNPLDNFIRRHLDGWLAGHGFEGSGRTRSRPAGDLLHVIHFQSCPGRHPGATGFTLNAMVVAPAVHRIWAGVELPASLEQAVWCCFRRAGIAGAPAASTWWEVASEPEQADLAAEVRDALARADTEFFPTWTSSAAITLFAEQQALPGRDRNQTDLILAILYGEQGRAADSRSLLERLHAASGTGGFARLVDAIRTRLRLESGP
jgi:hypothetical protein